MSSSSSADEARLHFDFRGQSVPVTHVSSINSEVAKKALESEIFRDWSKRCEAESNKKRIEMHSVEIQSVDMFGKRIGFMKINANCTLVDGETHHEHRLPGICFLRGGSVAILVALICEDEGGKAYSLLVDQPRIPIGQVSCLELPAGMIDSVNDGIAGTAAKEMEEECGIKVRPSDLTDLTELACQAAIAEGHLPCAGIPPSPGGCDEFLRYMYLERRVKKADLDRMKERLAGLRDRGEYITLRIVPIENLWKISADNKAICALYLVCQLRKEGKIPPLGGLLDSPCDPTYKMTDGRVIPALAYGLYNVPSGEDGEAIISEAIKAGYRHFDSASLYGNERVLGRCIRNSGIPREDFVVCSKVWNDAQKEGPAAVRKSVQKSLDELNCSYIDIMYIHWPVPGHFVATYKELQELCKEGKIRNIGLSNFGIPEYEELMSNEDIAIPPTVNQIEISPFMYRPSTIQYFQERNVLMAASKALFRASGIDQGAVKSISDAHGVSPAQVMLRWGLQKRLIVVAKTSNPSRMHENRSILHFNLSEAEIQQLDSLTSEEAIHQREELELQRRVGA